MTKSTNIMKLKYSNIHDFKFATSTIKGMTLVVHGHG